MLITLILFFIWNSIFFAKDSYGVLQSIDYNKTILIPKDFNIKNEVHYTINYVYHGDSIVSNDNHEGYYACYLSYLPAGNIYFFTKNGKILPGAKEFFKRCGISACKILGKSKGGFAVESLLINKEKESIKMKIFSPYIFKNTDIDEAIKKRELSSILIIINDIQVKWEMRDEPKGKERIRKGEFSLTVNKKIKIEIKYEDERQCETAIDID